MLAQESAFDELSAPAQGQVPIVTPTYLRQAVRDIPASVTVIDAETIATFGILTIPNALRMIEGTPPQRIGWVNYDLKAGRQSSFGPSRLTVMIDGIEVDSSHFQENVDWGDLPVSIDDVERVEVTRGPSNAGFGHALTTVLVNVVTKHPADVERGFVRATYGSFNSSAIFGRVGFSAGPMAVRLTFIHNGRDPIDDEGLGMLRTAHQSVNRFNLRTSTRVDAQTTLAIDAALLDATLSGQSNNTGQHRRGQAHGLCQCRMDAQPHAGQRAGHPRRAVVRPPELLGARLQREPGQREPRQRGRRADGPGLVGEHPRRPAAQARPGAGVRHLRR